MRSQWPGTGKLKSKWEAAHRAHDQQEEPEAAGATAASAAADPDDDTRAADLLRTASDAGWRLLVIGVVVGLLVYALTYLAVVTLPLIIAVFLTALLMPLANWLRRPNRVKPGGFGRGTSTLLALVVALAVYILVVTLIVTPAVAGFQGLVQSVNEAVAGLQGLNLPFGLDPALLTDAIQNAWSQARDLVSNNSGQIVSGAWTATYAVGQVVLGIVLVIVLTIYFVHSGDQLMEWVAALLPPRSRPVLRHSSRVAYDVMGRYVRGVALVGLFDAFGVGIVLLIVLDTALAVPLIVLTFVGAFLPVIGAFVSGLLAVLVALVTEDWIVALIVLAAVVLVQQLESNVFAPRIYGQALDLPSAVVLIVLTIGGILGGVVGLFLATPIAAVLTALVRDRPSSSPTSQGSTDGSSQGQAGAERSGSAAD